MTARSLLTLSAFLFTSLMVVTQINAVPKDTVDTPISAVEPSKKMNQTDSESVNGLRKGRSSISFLTPLLTTSGLAATRPDVLPLGKLGFWHMVGERVNLGLNIGFSLNSGEVEVETSQGLSSPKREERTSTQLDLSPVIRYYTRKNSEVALFFQGQLDFASLNDGDETTVNDKDAKGELTYNELEDLTLAMSFGFGAEWFLAHYVSLSGHLGLGIDIFRQGYQGFAIQTYTSGLTMQFYF